MALNFSNISLATITGVITILSTTAYAGGFGGSFGGPIGAGIAAKSLATHYTNLGSSSGSIKTKSYAEVGQYMINNGEIIKGYATAGNQLDVNVQGNVKIEQTSKAKSKIYIKGKNLLAKAYAKNNVKVYIQGQLSFENEESAYAIGRFTPLGTQMKSGATSHNKLEAKGLVRLSTGQIVSTSGQVGR